jgi:molybdate/tungstate transport system substrate-binding protein
VVVFYAASLARAFTELGDAFADDNPKVRLRVEVSGSQTAARKVSELAMRADVVASADATVIDTILIPEHAAWNIHFATNAVVIAHKDHSRFTDEVTTDNWHKVLTRPGVRLGFVDPDLGPIGYRTQLVWALAETQLGTPGLRSRLRAQVAPEHVMPDEGELLGLLASRAIDYAFMYESTADEHHLKMTRLPDSYNLGRHENASTYAVATVSVRMKHDEAPVDVHGAPVVYGVTIPTSAANPAGGARFIELLLSERGRRILERSGFRPIHPARCAAHKLLPRGLRPLVAAAP